MKLSAVIMYYAKQKVVWDSVFVVTLDDMLRLN